MCRKLWGTYFNQDGVDHLTNALKTEFKVYTDYNVTDYCGLKLKWNYTQGYVDVSMPNFVPKTLKKINIHLHKILSILHTSEIHSFMTKHKKWQLKWIHPPNYQSQKQR